MHQKQDFLKANQMETRHKKQTLINYCFTTVLPALTCADMHKSV